jgi:hypothetical protein
MVAEQVALVVDKVGEVQGQLAEQRYPLYPLVMAEQA